MLLSPGICHHCSLSCTSSDSSGGTPSRRPWADLGRPGLGRPGLGRLASGAFLGNGGGGLVGGGNLGLCRRDDDVHHRARRRIDDRGEVGAQVLHRGVHPHPLVAEDGGQLDVGHEEPPVGVVLQPVGDHVAPEEEEEEEEEVVEVGGQHLGRRRRVGAGRGRATHQIIFMMCTLLATPVPTMSLRGSDPLKGFRSPVGFWPAAFRFTLFFLLALIRLTGMMMAGGGRRDCCFPRKARPK